MAAVNRSSGGDKRHQHNSANRRSEWASRAITEVLESRCLLSSALINHTAGQTDTADSLVVSLNQVTPSTVSATAPMATGQGSATSPGPVLDTSSPVFQWSAVTGVTGMTGYQINLYDQTLSKSTSYQVGTSVTSYSPPSGALTAGDTFVWNVRTVEGTATGPESNYLYFQAPPAAVLPAPVAIGPGSTTKPGTLLTTSTPTLEWNAVTGVTGMTGYQIYLTDLTLSKTFSYQVGASATSYSVAAGTLAAGDDFVWDVRILVGTQSGPPSTYLYFQTPAATVTLPAPVATGQGSATSPGPVLISTSPVFQWDAVTGITGMTGYQINLYDQTLAKSYSYQVGTSVTSYSPPSSVLVAGDSFVWNVRTVEGSTTGPESNYLYFTAPPAVVLPAPVATGPGSTAKPGPVLTTSTPTLSWDAVTGVTGLTGYQVYLTDETLSKTFSYQVGASVTSYTVAAGTLTAGDTFVWNVRALVGTESGPPSTYLYFQTPPAVTVPAPVATGQGSATSPGPVLDTSAPVFQWDAVTGVTGMTGYQINLYDQTLGKSYSYQVGTSVTSYSPPSSVLVAGDKFVWNVRTVEGTTTGPESNYLYFQAPPAVVLPAPVATGPGNTTKPGPVLTTSTPTLTWDAVTGVTGLTGYQIYLTDETLSKTFSYQVGASVTSYEVPAGTLAAGDTFVWNVRVLVGTQSGPPSAYLYFQTPAATVTLPAPVAIGQGTATSPGPVVDSSSPIFQWDAVTGVTGLTGYQINLYDQTLGKSYSYSVGTSVTSYSPPSSVLVAGDKFVWNVRILVGTESGPPSAYLYFQAPPAVVLPAPVAIGPGGTTKPGTLLTTSTPTLQWNAVTGVTGLTGYQIYLTDLTLSKTFSYQVGATATNFAVPAGTLAAGDNFVWDVRVLVGTQSGPPSTYLYFQTPAGTSSPNPPTTPAEQIAADTEKLTRLEDEQHETVRSLKAATPDTPTYTTLLAKYDAWEKRIKALKNARAELEAEG